MASLNKVQLIGYVGDEPKVVQGKTGSYVASMTIATTEKGYVKKDGTKVEDKTEWHNVVFFGVLAQKVIAPYVHKGSMIYVEGKLHARSYDDKNGVKRYITEINAEVIQLLDRRQEQSYSTAQDQSYQPTSQPKQGVPLFGPGGILESNSNEEELPF